MSSEPQSPQQWYGDHRPTYAALAEIVRGTIESLLRSGGIDYLSVTHRTKTPESFAEKVDRKGYNNPASDMTDLAGIRVITFIESDVQRVCEVIRGTYQVHEDKSLDKAGELDVDRFGYRSVHFVCDLGAARTKLPEFALYRGFMFEVQVRTVLQHAWAEIEHDRNYKLAGALPAPLQRRLYAVAGTLEVADREFNALAAEVDLYAKKVAETTKAGNLDVELNSTSIREYLKAKLPRNLAIKTNPLLPRALQELRGYGVSTLAELDKLLSERFLELSAKYKPMTTDLGLLRSAMMFDDFERFVEHSWQQDFTRLVPGTERLLAEKYGAEKAHEFGERLQHEKTARKLKQRRA
jgi:ppGpp synthetase/RelA/SpoT-type nucleotidyltranferase